MMSNPIGNRYGLLCGRESVENPDQGGTEQGHHGRPGEGTGDGVEDGDAVWVDVGRL